MAHVVYALGLVTGNIKAIPFSSYDKADEYIAEREEHVLDRRNFPVLYGYDDDSFPFVCRYAAGRELGGSRYKTWFAFADSFKSLAQVLSTPVGWTHADA